MVMIQPAIAMVEISISGGRRNLKKRKWEARDSVEKKILDRRNRSHDRMSTPFPSPTSRVAKALHAAKPPMGKNNGDHKENDNSDVQNGHCFCPICGWGLVAPDRLARFYHQHYSRRQPPRGMLDVSVSCWLCGHGPGGQIRSELHEEHGRD
jgi:hypothetical protein